MDENKGKKKILIAIVGCLIGSAVVLCATAAIVNLVTGAGFAAAFRNKVVYLVWVCLIAVGVAAVAIDIRVRGSCATGNTARNWIRARWPASS